MATDEQLNRTINVPCICPGGEVHPDGDEVTLKETLDFLAVRAVRYAAQMEQDEDSVEVNIPTLLAVMSEGYILNGVESWTLRDGKQAIEVNKANVRQYILGNMVAAQLVGDLADVLYRPQVFLPLAELARRSSQRSQMNGSTSAPTESSSTSQPPTDNGSNHESSTPSVMRRKRSRRSSTTSTPMDSTGETSAAFAGA